MKETTRRAFERILRAGLKAVDPEEAVKNHVVRRGNELLVDGRSYDLARFKRIFVFGAGKGTAPMARALEDVLGDSLTEGWISVKYGHGLALSKTRVMESGHPVPDDPGLRAAGVVLANLEKCTEDDLVLFAFSGGGSALLPSLRPPLQFPEKQATTRLLLECGASIDEINTIRKHLSRSKGGALARAAHPAAVISLFLSDVVGDKLEVIASGPTVPDPSTFEDCLRILERYALSDKAPRAVLDLLRK
ncbi:MAG: glycerate-2-kinase family protein, partial [Syntrophobacteraceae bacterium]